MGILRRLLHYFRYLALNGRKWVNNGVNRAIKDMGFNHELYKVAKAPSNRHGYLAPKNDPFSTI